MGPPDANGAANGDLPGVEAMRLLPDVSTEPVMPGQGLVFWLRGPCEGGFRSWERVAVPSGGEFTVEPGVCAAAAAAVQARQPVGLFSGFRRRSDSDGSWKLPGGGLASQQGDRRTDALMVWSEGGIAPLDEDWLRQRWSTCERIRRLGKSLFLVLGADPPGTTAAAGETGCPRAAAERLRAAARIAGDVPREVTALTDLGLMDVNEGKLPQAVARLEAALALVRPLGDRPREGDVLGYLGRAALKGGRAEHALTYLQPALAIARDSGDVYAEKSFLEMIGFAHADLHDVAASLAAFESALELARAAGHRDHEAELLWHVGVQNAELGRREAALAKAQAAVDLLETTRQPQAAVFADYLTRYRNGEAADTLRKVAATTTPGALWGGPIVVSAGADVAGSISATVQGPGLLRMAVTAAASAARFLTSGMKTVAQPMLGRRLRTCAACPHHTGLRCRLCGCFTNVKARLPHEDCPVGKWPS